MSDTALVRQPAPTSLEAAPARTLPILPWRDPHTIPSGELTVYISRLEQACLENPQSADLRTCLGLAYAVNYDVYKSMDALEAATAIDPGHFWAQLKYGELQYRLRALQRAEEETLKAVELAETPWQLSVARKQLQEIRSMSKQSIRNITWTKPLAPPALLFSAAIIVMFVAMMWK